MDGILLLAHGTIRDLSELPEFLRKIRRGREPSAELVEELTRRYQAIGGPPLLETTQAQARALALDTGLPSLVAMRLWRPTVQEVLPAISAAGITRLCLLPLAPFSVQVYVDAARAALASVPSLEVLAVPAWGEHPGFVRAHAELIRRRLPDSPAEVILTAHSLPMAVIEAGDRYADQVSACARAVERELGRSVHLCYQSEGADGGRWLGPSLSATLRQVAAKGARQVVVAPFGFLADHVETLYDLDIEARAEAQALGLGWHRVPALNLEPSFIAALGDLARRALGRSS